MRHVVVTQDLPLPLSIHALALLSIHLHLLRLTQRIRSPTGRNGDNTMDGSVIVPLYVFPSFGAWAPVYDLYVVTAIVPLHFRELIELGQRLIQAYNSLPL